MGIHVLVLLHIILYTLCVITSSLYILIDESNWKVKRRHKDDRFFTEYYTSFLTALFFFIPLELIYWLLIWFLN